MGSWNRLMLPVLLLSSTCGLRGPEIPYDPAIVNIVVTNSSDEMLVLVEGPAGSSFEDAAAYHYVQSARPLHTVAEFTYPNLSDDKGEWCFDRELWLATSRSGTIYIRESNHRTATNASVARALRTLQGPRVLWSDEPDVDVDDLEIVATVDAEVCFDGDTYLYDFTGEGGVVGDPNPLR